MASWKQCKNCIQKKWKVTNNMIIFTYLLPKSLSFDNFAEVEADIYKQIEGHSYDEIVLDAQGMNYISSAGLRVVLGLKKKFDKVTVANASISVYDIFEMTGFTNIVNVEKALRQVSVEGCKIVGKGAHGTVYSTAPDTIVKVYEPGSSLVDINKERELSKKAFVLGLPTAIALDTVKVGEQYGTVFELLNAGSCVDYVNQSQENTDDFIDKAVAILKKMHSTVCKDNDLPDMKLSHYRYVDHIRQLISDQEYQKARKIIDSIPDSKTLIHGDFHLKNQLLAKGNQLMLIDMDTLCTGNPIFEMASVCNSYFEFGEISVKAIEDFLDIPIDTANYLWKNISRKYYADLDDEQYQQVVDKARLIGCVRALHYFKKRNFAEEHKEKCLKDLRMLLSKF